MYIEITLLNLYILSLKLNILFFLNILLYTLADVRQSSTSPNPSQTLDCLIYILVSALAYR